MAHRLFIGLRPPLAVREALVDTMEALDGARWQDDAQLHLTLRFVGEVERPVANDLAAALGGLRRSQFDLAIDGVGHFESKGLPSAIWARVPLTPELNGLRAKVERVCEEVGLGRETRRFTPHITIARLSRRAGPVAPWLARHGGLRLHWRADSFLLFESHLLSAGAVYEAAARYPLHG